MRLSLTRLCLPLAAAALIATTMTSQAHQRVYADAYGNLVVHNPSGYKQIIVGKGHLAEEARKELGEPEVIHHHGHHGHDHHYQRSADRGNDRMHRADGATCIPYGVVLKGRSFMYGVNQGEAVYVDKYCR